MVCCFSEDFLSGLHSRLSSNFFLLLQDPLRVKRFASRISLSFQTNDIQLYYPHSDVTAADPKGQGFVVTNFPNGADVEAEKDYMRSYDKEDRTVAALQTLAKNFVVCDRWFASMPGPTVPNRLFVHTASSGGYAGTHTLYSSNAVGGAWVTGHETPPESLISIFEVLQDNNKTWGIYSMDYSLQLPSQV